MRWPGTSPPRRIDGLKVDAERAERRPPRQCRIPRPPDQGDGQARGRGRRLEQSRRGGPPLAAPSVHAFLRSGGGCQRLRAESTSPPIRLEMPRPLDAGGPAVPHPLRPRRETPASCRRAQEFAACSERAILVQDQCRANAQIDYQICQRAYAPDGARTASADLPAAELRADRRWTLARPTTGAALPAAAERWSRSGAASRTAPPDATTASAIAGSQPKAPPAALVAQSSRVGVRSSARNCRSSDRPREADQQQDLRRPGIAAPAEAQEEAERARRSRSGRRSASGSMPTSWCRQPARQPPRVASRMPAGIISSTKPASGRERQGDAARRDGRCRARAASSPAAA